MVVRNMGGFTWMGLLPIIAAANAYYFADPMENPDLYHGDIVGMENVDRNAVTQTKRLWPKGVIPYQIDAGLDARKFADPMENPGLFEGDIAGMDNTDRNAVISKDRLWPKGIIPYIIDYRLAYTKTRIAEAMRHIEARTCIRFVPYDGKQPSHLRILPEEGCWSYWGRRGGQQKLSLERGCESMGTIIHELVHAIGFKHEHSRSDRDDYVYIHWNNIRAGESDQFAKLRPSLNRLITPFDYDSIMLYGETTFSKDGYSKTMTAKKARVRLLMPSEKGKLSANDAKRINKLYGC